jgi:multisubunit Na+/H+ antiporter MnhB subunit
MPFGLIPVLCVALIVLGFIHESSKQATRRRRDQASRALPLPSWIRWIIAGYMGLAVVMFSPQLRGQFPKSLLEAVMTGLASFVVTGLVMAALASLLPFTRRLLRTWSRPALYTREQRRLRREKKKLRLRRNLARWRGQG